MRPLWLVCALIAGPATAQDPAIASVADGLAVAEPEQLMRAALANCIAYDFDTAILRITDAGWIIDSGDDGTTALVMDGIYAMINPAEGFCSVQSAEVDMDRAAYVAGDLMTTTYGGTTVTEVDETGCGTVSSDMNMQDYIAVSSDGMDPACDPDGGSGSALTYFSY